ncbi:MAG: 2-dehydropantoate 2-reductase [Tardiphaga sp.]
MARPICIAGAGSIGCYVGGMLAAAGREVSLLARPRIVDELHRHGLRLTSVDGIDCRLAAAQLRPSEDPDAMDHAGFVLVTVKSGDTEAMAGIIASRAPTDAVVVSLQNGVGNVAVLRRLLPQHRVLGAMVPFNVIAKGEGWVHRATSGDIAIERDANTAAALSVRQLRMRESDDIVGVQWGKLLVNLNNALNALSDLPLHSQLMQRDWRLLFADQIAEGLDVLKAAGIKPVAMTPIPVGLTPHLLRLPDVLFSIVLNRVMKIDADARSSMWEDLQQRRRTEIDYLQGVIIQVGTHHAVRTPLARRVTALIRQAEHDGGSPALTADQIRNG